MSRKITSVEIVRLPNGNYSMKPFQEDITARIPNVTEAPEFAESSPTTRRRWFLNLKFIGITAAVLSIIIVPQIVDIMTVSAEEAAYAAAKAKQVAIQNGCTRVIEKVTACYSGNKESCKALQESNAWFRQQFGEYPELACPNSKDPLVFGGDKE